MAPTAALLLATATLLCTLVALQPASATTSTVLAARLRTLRFLNSGTARATDRFHLENITPNGLGESIIYLEADNVSCTTCVWSDGGRYNVPHPYLFLSPPSAPLGPSPPPPPVAWVTLPPLDWTNGPILSQGQLQPSLEACQALCAATTSPTPCKVGLFISGSVRHGECWLSGDLANAPRTDFCNAAPGQSCSSFAFPTKYRGLSPASGLRSAVPLGGLGAGCVELRADGSLHEWTIHNAGPNGAAKIQTFPDTFFAAAVGAQPPRVLLTHPPVDLAGAGLSEITYSGTHPVSQLDFVLDDSAGVQTSLYAFSHLRAGDMAASSRPSAAFVLVATNTGSSPVNVTFALNLALRLEPDQTRPGTPLPFPHKPTSAANASDCMARCDAVPACASFVFVRATGLCTLQSDAPLNYYQPGSVSGLRGFWEAAPSPAQCLTLVRPGSGPMHGNVSVCASSTAPQSGASSSWAWTTGLPQAGHILGWLSNPQSSSPTLSSHQGAVSVTQLIPADTTATLTLTLGWSFPARDHYNYKPGAPFQPFGNRYAHTYPGGAVEAAWGNVSAGTDRETELSAAVGDIASWHAVLLPEDFSVRSLLPDWLADLLLNSVSHARSAMWWQNCPHCHGSADPRVANSSFGIFRQFEALDCPDIDSIHNTGERHLPYITLFPDATRSKLAAWAGNQGSDGMLAEQILNSDPDSPQGRIMSDSTSMFIVYVLELLRWGGDNTTLQLYYPTVKRAAQWQMMRAEELGLPQHLETTYDILQFPQYQLSAYASVFHLLAMSATVELAKVAGDEAFAAKAAAAFSRGQAAFDQLQWNSTLGAYNAGSSGCTAGQGCTFAEGLFSDSFYGQVLAYSAGLGDLLAHPERLDSHLAVVWNATCAHVPYPNLGNGTLAPGCPNGLLALVGRAKVGISDWQVWEMPTYNHVSLLLQRGQMAPAAALELARGSGTSYAQRANDQWNIAGLKRSDGLPVLTSHYGYHMVAWHMALGLTRQVMRAEDNTSVSLTWFPRVQGMCAGGNTTRWQWPVLLPGVVGWVSCVGLPLPAPPAGDAKLTFQLVSGQLTLSWLAVGGAVAGGPITVAEGRPAVWYGTIGPPPEVLPPQ